MVPAPAPITGRPPKGDFPFVYIVIRNHSDNAGNSWTHIVRVFTDETEAGVYAIDLDERLGTDFDQYFVEKWPVFGEGP